MTATDRPDLLGLAGQARVGSRAALERLLAALHPVLHRYYIRSLGDEGDVASDLAQEALVRIARGIGGCHAEGEGQIIAWALRIARNLEIDWLRSVHSEPTYRARSLPIDAHALGVAPPAEEPARTPALGVLFALLEDAEGSLPESTRDLLYLRLTEHASWEQVGKAMGIPATAAKRRFQRSQHRIRSEILRRVRHLPAETREIVLAQIRDFGVPSS